MEEKVVKQPKNNFDWLREVGWQKGQSGNLKGRPKGKTLKDFTREFLANMSDESRIEFLKELPAETIWKMAEGNPKQDVDSNVTGSIEVKDINYIIPNGHNTDTNA